MKKIRYWMVFVLIALIFGCTKAVIRADLPKTFPNVEILMAKLDRTEALEILNKFKDNCSIYVNVYSVEWRADGLHYIREFREFRGEYRTPTGRIQTIAIWREPRTFSFEDFQSLAVENGYGPNPGSCQGWRSAYRIYLRSQIRGEGGGLLVYSEEERDQVIAALLTLCPNIK